MAEQDPLRVAIVYPGNAAARRDATPDNNRFAAVFRALMDRGVHAEAAVWHDDLRDAVRRQLTQVDAALVWVNPVVDGHDRSVLDALLRDVSAAGVFVSAHPDVILALGTKEVLYTTREIGWGCDTHLYRSLEQMRRELPTRLAVGGARVLKQYRGNGGAGVWKVEPAAHSGDARGGGHGGMPVRVRHAQRGSVEEMIPLDRFLHLCERYFEGGGRMVDQAWQPRLPEGMVRCYLVHGAVVGFGHQAVNALYPARPGAPPEDGPAPGPRLYHPPDLAPFQGLKALLERDWVPAAQRLLGIDTQRLPLLWDCDFLLGPKTAAGDDTYVLCEINVSSVAPFPDSAVAPLADAAIARARAARRARGGIPA